MQKINDFLDSFLKQIEKIGLNINGLDLDHIAYQASSSSDYESMKPEFEKLGKEVSENIIGGRRVAIHELFSPIEYKTYSIPALEIIESKEGQNPKSEFQHVEFVVSKSFEDYLKDYPEIDWDTSSMKREEFAHLKLNFENGLTLKFCNNPILSLVKKGE